MTFLVLVQGAELAGELGIGVGPKVGVALLVGVVTIGVAYAVEGRLSGVSGREADGAGDDGE